MTAPAIDVWPPLDPAAHLRPRRRELPFPLADPPTLFARARHALWHGVRLVGLAPGEAVLVPAYHHGSEIEALLRAGLEPRFYAGTGALEPDEAELEALLGPSVRALYVIDYLGFPQAGRRWRAWCDARGLLLIEDAAQAWLADADGAPAGSLADLAIYCIYKTVGVPDGAALHVRGGGSVELAPDGIGLRGLARRHLGWLAQRGLPAPAVAGRRARYDAERDFALGDPRVGASAMTRHLVPRVADGRAAAARRARYRYLLDRLGDAVPPPFDRLPTGAAPFAFPVASPEKERLIGRLRAAGIGSLDFWSVAHPALPARHPAAPSAAERRRTTVALPVHQELRAADLERIVGAVKGSRGARPAPRLERIGSADEIASEWDALALASRNVFATREWISTWWRHFGRAKRSMLTACRGPSGEVVAILPLYLYARRPVSILRLMGHGPSDELGPVCDPAQRPPAAAAMRRLLVASGSDLLLAEHLHDSEEWAPLDGRVIRREASPVLRFEGSWDAFLASRSPNFRQQTRRRERLLGREHELRYRRGGEAGQLDADMTRLFELHAARWEAGGSLFAGRHETFHRDFARIAAERGWLRLWFLELDGEAVAAWYGFRYAGTESYYQAGRDPRWEAAGVGIALLAHSIREALNDGVTEYRFLRGGEPFKYRFATHETGLQTLVVGNGVAGWATALAAARLPGDVGPAMLRRLGRRRLHAAE